MRYVLIVIAVIMWFVMTTVTCAIMIHIDHEWIEDDSCGLCFMVCIVSWPILIAMLAIAYILHNISKPAAFLAGMLDHMRKEDED